MNESDLRLLKDLVIENKCDELLIERLDAFSKEAQMKKLEYDDETFSDQELICRLMSCLDEEAINRNYSFLKYICRRFQIDGDLFFDFTGRELK